MMTRATHPTRAEEKLHLQSRALEASANAILITDRDGVIEWVNPAFTECTGYSMEEAVGRKPRFLNSGAQSPSYYEDLWDTIRSGSVWHGELLNRRKDGSLYWEEQTITPVTGSDGEIQHFIAVKQDVTKRKEADDKLRRSRERWQELVENQRDAILILVNGVIRYVNPAGVDILQATSSDEVLGRHVGQFMVSEADREKVEERAAQILQGKAIERQQFEIERFDGEHRIVESYAVPVTHKGKRAAQAIVRDVTEQKRTQKQLQQAQKMETVGELAGGIAHDFNNILHAAKLYLQMSLGDLSEDEPVHEFVAKAEEGLERAETLVNKLLTFSRPGEEQTEQKRVNLAEVVRNALDLVGPSLPKNAVLRQAFGKECVVVGDPGQLHQVATNILTNAGQAMEGLSSSKRHVLDVDVRSIDVDDNLARRHLNLEPGCYVRISISDTGPGMDTETRERIFDPFFTTKVAGKGTGLGLSMVHGIVQAHDGEITVYTQPGEGTTLDVYLPCETEETAALGFPDTPERRGRVLLVDDDEHLAELEALRLRRLGYGVTTCASVPEALQAFREDPNAFHLVLTDYVMPRRSGLDLTRELRTCGHTQPIVLMSGFSAQVSAEEASAAGVSTFLRKPVGSEELKQTLSSLLP